MGTPEPNSEPRGSRTADDYWGLPEGRRAELIDGELHDLAAPSLTHQQIIGELYRRLADEIDRGGGPCRAFIAPVAVNLKGDETTFVEPDVIVVCDPSKLSERGCEGAPDLVVEVVSPGSRKMDYSTKLGLYIDAHVREYWIVDPSVSRTLVYRLEDENPAPVMYAFDQPIPVGIWDGGFSVRVSELL